MQLQVMLAMCLVGLVAATSPEAEPRRQMTTAEMIVAIHDLRKEVASIRETVGRMRSIGRTLITKLDTYVAKSGHVDGCVNLLGLREGPMPTPGPTPPKPTPGPQLTPAQMSTRIYLLQNSVHVIEAKVGRMRAIGMANIGKLNSFVEAAKRGLCQTDDGPCTDGFSHFGTSCYKEVIGEKKSWADAQATCHAIGGHLPIIDSQEENDFILGLLQSQERGHAAWTGLNRIQTAQWSWVHTNIEPSYTHWSPNKLATPNKKCAYLCLMSNSWVPHVCQAPKRIVCEKPVPDDD